MSETMITMVNVCKGNIYISNQTQKLKCLFIPPKAWSKLWLETWKILTSSKPFIPENKYITWRDHIDDCIFIVSFIA